MRAVETRQRVLGVVMQVALWSECYLISSL
jgi:hypothetical protein